MGLLIAISIHPEFAVAYWYIILALMVPVVYFFATMTSISSSNPFKNIGEKNDKPNYSNRSIDDLYNYSKASKEAELNALLEKVKKIGVENLSAYEKRRLEDLSKELH